MFTITKQFSFEASHQLFGMPEGHACARLHGHSYRVELVLKAEELDEKGFLRDYGELKPFGQYLDEKFDHRHLNDVLDGNPTAERLAEHLFGVAKHFAPELDAVRVSETQKTWAEYTLPYVFECSYSENFHETLYGDAPRLDASLSDVPQSNVLQSDVPRYDLMQDESLESERTENEPTENFNR